jgi:uncharacterized protein DUF6941
VRADFLVVADAAQVAEGKLYLIGGAWNRLAISQFPGAAPIGIALGFLVGWEETNQARTASLTLENEDGMVVLGPIEMRIEVGRPAGAIPGEEQRIVMAVNGQVSIPSSGGYAIVVRIGSEELARTRFRVVQA